MTANALSWQTAGAGIRDATDAVTGVYYLVHMSAFAEWTATREHHDNELVTGVSLEHAKATCELDARCTREEAIR